MSRMASASCPAALLVSLLVSLLISLPGRMIVPLTCSGQETAPVIIEGTVTDGRGEPMHYVNVQIVGTLEGTFTDREGCFRFITYRTGRFEVQATMMGCEPALTAVTAAPGDTVRILLVLRPTLIERETVVVAASAYTSGDEEEGVTMRPLEIITTPGAAADIFGAMQSFPGVVMVDEGSGLFVRGGDVSETVTLLDGATVVHPYRYESPTGGVFGTISPFLVSGTVFSTGGFSARYGNALSGVLVLESQDLPDRQRLYLNLGLAAASVGIDYPVSERLGLRFSGNRSTTDAMFRLNGQRDLFTRTPQGSDLNMNLVWRYSATGQIKLFAFTNDEEIGVRVREPSFDGIYRGSSRNTLANLSFRDTAGRWLVRGSLSANRYRSRRTLGALDLDPADTTTKLRLDAEREMGRRTVLALGGEVERTASTFRGSVPAVPDMLDPAAAVIDLDEAYAGLRSGWYAEVSWTLFGRLAAAAGVRADHHSLANQTVVDPRLRFTWALAEGTDLCFATGIYHSFPVPYAFNPASGNPDLGSQRAGHVIAGLHHHTELFQARLEFYRKQYRGLAIEDDRFNLAGIGDGSARGIDLFCKYGAFLLTRFNGWVSYSYLRSRRLQPRRLGEEIVHESGPTPYDITHHLTLIGQYRLISYLSLGVSLRSATGRPVTPIAGAVPGSGGGWYLPVEGPVGSERLPPFLRVDTDLSFFWPFGNGHSAVFYLGISNLFDRSNVSGYEYSADYSERYERITRYRRFIYFGATLTLAGS